MPNVFIKNADIAWAWADENWVTHSLRRKEDIYREKYGAGSIRYIDLETSGKAGLSFLCSPAPNIDDFL